MSERKPATVRELLGSVPNIEIERLTPEQYAERARIQGERNRATVEETRSVIQRLKASRKPAEERGLIQRLRQLGHPDVDGLIGALTNRDTQPGVPAFRPRKGT